MKRLITLTALALCLSAQADMTVRSIFFIDKERTDFIAAQEAFEKQNQKDMILSLVLAASKGDPYAAHGMYYAYSHLEPINFQKADYWLRQAASYGALEAINELSMEYYSSELKRKNLVVAYALSTLAATSEYKSEARGNARYTSAFLSKAQLARGDQLVKDLQKPNNFIKALDAYLKKHPIENPDPNLP